MEVMYPFLIRAKDCFLNFYIDLVYRAIYLNGSNFFNGRVFPGFLYLSTILTNDKIRTTRMIKPIIQPNTITQTLLIPSIIIKDLIL